MTTYSISFVNKYGISRCFKLDNLFDLRRYIPDEDLRGLVVGKIVDDTIVYFTIYKNGRRDQKLIANMPLIK